MSNIDQDRLFFQIKWTMPGNLRGGPTEPLGFFVTAVEMCLVEAPFFVEGLVGVIDSKNVDRLRVRIKTILNLPECGPTQRHTFAFMSASTPSVAILQCGTTLLFGELQKSWSRKTLSLIPMPWDRFQIIKEMAATGGVGYRRH